MRTATTLLACMLCVGTCAAVEALESDTKPVFACNLKAISAADRPRYDELVKRVRTAIRDRTEISNGYAFKLDSKAVPLPEAAEWIVMERLCCPFLTLQLSAAGNEADYILTLSGPEGVKPLITAEFPVR